MRIIHVLPYIGSAYGGPVQVAGTLAAETVRAGHEVSILPQQEKAPRELLNTLVYWPGWGELRKIQSRVPYADVVHVHGLWNIPGTMACAAARRAGVPYVVTLHGMLDRWSLGRSRYKKAVYAAVVERRNLNSASALHVLNSSEYEEAQEFGFKSPAFLLPNGITIKDYVDLPKRRALTELFPETHNRVVVLFLGRLHPKKGLDLLLSAMSEARQRIESLHLLIAGPDERGYRHTIEQTVGDLGLTGAVTFAGEVRGEKKRVLLGCADLFALTSYEEGDAVAVKEAMAAGLPVVITRQCRLPEAGESGAGIIVDSRKDVVADALVRLAGDRSLRERAGRAGAELVQRSFDAGSIGEKLLGIYADLLARNYESSTWVQDSLTYRRS